MLGVQTLLSGLVAETSDAKERWPLDYPRREAS